VYAFGETVLTRNAFELSDQLAASIEETKIFLVANYITRGAVHGKFQTIDGVGFFPTIVVELRGIGPQAVIKRFYECRLPNVILTQNDVLFRTERDLLRLLFWLRQDHQFFEMQIAHSLCSF